MMKFASVYARSAGGANQDAADLNRHHPDRVYRVGHPTHCAEIGEGYS